jgi:hypothetical protein
MSCGTHPLMSGFYDAIEVLFILEIIHGACNFLSRVFVKSLPETNLAALKQGKYFKMWLRASILERSSK